MRIPAGVRMGLFLMGVLVASQMIGVRRIAPPDTVAGLQAAATVSPAANVLAFEPFEPEVASPGSAAAEEPSGVAALPEKHVPRLGSGDSLDRDAMQALAAKPSPSLHPMPECASRTAARAAAPRKITS